MIIAVLIGLGIVALLLVCEIYFDYIERSELARLILDVKDSVVNESFCEDFCEYECGYCNEDCFKGIRKGLRR